MRSLILSILLVGPALAETPLDRAAFETLVEGKTLTFSVGTSPYGVEYYAPNRQVIWSFQGNECITVNGMKRPVRLGQTSVLSMKTAPNRNAGRSLM